MLDEILDHRRLDSALNKDNGYSVTKRGNKRLKRSTQGWEIKVLWKDGSTSWIPLRDIKESNPVETAEYAVATNIDD